MTIEATALAAEIESGTAGPILDVRSRQEFLQGHIPGAIQVSFHEIGRRLSEIAARRDERLVVYCGHGPRARIAAVVLRRHGFRHIVYLRGHMSGWTRQGLPEERS